MSGYVLDGIETAMAHKPFGAWETILCPCGWKASVYDAGALRFHYTHCPKARTPTPQPSDSQTEPSPDPDPKSSP